MLFAVVFVFVIAVVFFVFVVVFFVFAVVFVVVFKCCNSSNRQAQKGVSNSQSHNHQHGVIKFSEMIIDYQLSKFFLNTSIHAIVHFIHQFKYSFFIQLV